VEYKKFHDIFPLKLPFANIEFTLFSETNILSDKLFAKYNTVDRTLKDLRLLTPRSLAYAVFVRYNELCNIKAKHIKMYDHYVDILTVLPRLVSFASVVL
jgi:hypothetical protein